MFCISYEHSPQSWLGRGQNLGSQDSCSDTKGNGTIAGMFRCQTSTQKNIPFGHCHFVATTWHACFGANFITRFTRSCHNGYKDNKHDFGVQVEWRPRVGCRAGEENAVEPWTFTSYRDSRRPCLRPFRDIW